MPSKPHEYIFPGILAAQAIHATVRFRIPDLLGSGAKTAAELALACGAHAPTLERLLRALTSIGMFFRTPEGKYRNTPFTEVLRADHPQSLSSECMFLPAPFMWRPLGELYESVQTGEPAFERIFGQHFFAYLAEHPEDAANFNRVMAQEIMWTTPALLRAYDFSRFKLLVDVGGGHGLFLSHLLKAVPGLRGVLFDQPQVTAGSIDLLKGDAGERIKFVGGSFFDSVPEGGDAYVLRRIIHDWEDKDASKILGNVRRAMGSGGTLLLIEALLDSAAHPAGLIDLMMLVLGGRERTEGDFRALLHPVGFSINRFIPAGSYSLIECHPV